MGEMKIQQPQTALSDPFLRSQPAPDQLREVMGRDPLHELLRTVCGSMLPVHGGKSSVGDLVPPRFIRQQITYQRSQLFHVVRIVGE